MKKLSLRTPATLCAACLAVASALTANAQDKSLKDQLSEFTTDLSIPTSPAAAHAGLSADNVLLPKNRREFEAGVSHLFNGTGRPTGVIEFAPYYIARGGKLRFADYRRSTTFRALTKTSIGLADGKRKAGDAEISATGLSLSVVLADLGDPIYSYELQRCINKVQVGMLERARAAPLGEGTDIPPQGSTTEFTPEEELQDDRALTEYKVCLAAREPQLWNRSRLAVGVMGGRGRELEGAQRRLHFGTGWWLSAQYGFEGLAALRRTLGSDDGYYDCIEPGATRCGKAHAPSRWERSAMLTVHARRVSGASRMDLSLAGELPEETQTLLGARLTYGSAQRAVFLETSRTSVKGSGSSSRLEQHAAGLSFRVSENLWINAITGRRRQFVDGRLESIANLTLQYGAASEPLVAAK
jgi:hypothetical protein